MRPTKLTPNMVKVFEDVLCHSDDALLLTDREICFVINERVEAHERISFRTFQRYKAVALMFDEPEVIAEKVQKDVDHTINMEVYYQLHRCWMAGRINQKRVLGARIHEKKDGWQRYRFLLQQKFPEFREKGEVLIEGMTVDEFIGYTKKVRPDFVHTAYPNCRIIEAKYDPTVEGNFRYFEYDEEKDVKYELPHYRMNRHCGCKYDALGQERDVKPDDGSDIDDIAESA